MYLLMAMWVLSGPGGPKKEDHRKLAKTAISEKVESAKCKANLRVFSQMITRWIPRDRLRMRMARRLHRRIRYANSVARQSKMVALMAPLIATCSRRKAFRKRYAFKDRRAPSFSGLDGSLMIQGEVYVAGRYWTKRRVKSFRKRYAREIKMLRQVGYGSFLFVSARHRRVYRWRANVKY